MLTSLPQAVELRVHCTASKTVLCWEVVGWALAIALRAAPRFKEARSFFQMNLLAILQATCFDERVEALQRKSLDVIHSGCCCFHLDYDCCYRTDCHSSILNHPTFFCSKYFEAMRLEWT
jgi:hypothetical protein